jgi:hypothetical protein
MLRKRAAGLGRWIAAAGLVGTVKKPSVVCAAFSSRGGNPRCLRISISGVSFHKPSLAPFFAFCLFIAFFLEKFSVKKPQERR